MAQPPLTFPWFVSTSGYRWVQAEVNAYHALCFDRRLGRGPRPVLSDGVPSGQPYERRAYQPLRKHPALFRHFAALNAYDAEDLRAFADEYGLLGIGRSVSPRAGGPGPTRTTWGETLNDWQHHIAALRAAVRLWDLVRDGSADALGEAIEWRGPVPDRGGQSPPELGRWLYRFPPDLPDGAPRFDSVIYLEHRMYQEGDLVMPAKMFVQRTVNAFLRGHVSGELVYDLDVGRHATELVPDALVSALWLQFAQAIAEDRQFRACKQCGKWFQVYRDEDRRTGRKEFCQDACKSRDYRLRRERARRLKGEGKRVPEIARDLGTDVVTVKKWLSKRKV
jgi:hypothetical protein